jgi:hypothetical protein
VSSKSGGYQLLPNSCVPIAAIAATASLTKREPNTADVLQELEDRTKDKKNFLDAHSTTDSVYRLFEKTLKDRIEILAVWDDLKRYEQEIQKDFEDRFPTDIPHIQ